MKQKVFSVQGEEVKEIELDNSVFGREVSDGAIYYAIRNELANKRVGTACTKTRGEVKGTNNKPWAQKGTGRARSGDWKSPIRVGGGTVFGPKPRDYSYTIPRKMKRVALTSILSLKTKEERLRVVEDFTIESGKTKDLASILNNLVDGGKTVLILKDDDQMLRRAGRNIPALKMLSYNRLRAHDLYYGENILVLEAAANNLSDFYGKKDK